MAEVWEPPFESSPSRPASSSPNHTGPAGRHPLSHPEPVADLALSQSSSHPAALTRHGKQEAGRLGPGHTYRLYSSAAYENYFAKFAPIPMLHTPMDPVLLLLAFLGVPRLDVFPWPTPPPSDAVAAAIRRLRAIGAIEDDGSNTEGSRASSAAVRCTKLGYRLAALPVAPRYARMMLAAITASAELKALA
ncbi:FAS4 [Symbiodinium natans]|uniref:FAS4 protein n=1 Tax=Symbiodinium natans TaxID=878477 RepID=A0A812PNH6_9DINO|nr:FAS4 [Symbiodinium natans]